MQGKAVSILCRAALAIFTIMLLPTGTWAATHEKVLHTFNPEVTDGFQPYAGLISDTAGNRYGTQSGGTHNSGTVFEIEP